MLAKDFVKNHNHINYCEVIILRSGEIEHANPSHTEKLIDLSKYEREELWNIIPITDSPMHWLIDKLGAVCIWYDFIISPSYGMNDAQIETINYLIKSNVVSPSILRERG